MPDTEYTHPIDQCDVASERRPALERFREKRREWLSWLHTDEIHPIWPTLHTMVWTDVAFKALTAFAVGNDENALSNPLIAEALVTGHVATQVLTIRRLVEDTPKKRISLRTLVKDLKRHIDAFTRENYVCYDGLPYDYQAARNARFIENAGNWGQGGLWVPRGRPQDDALSEALHVQFDKLAGVDSTKRCREDRLPARVLATIQEWLDDTGADELVAWSHAYLAHAGGPSERARLANSTVTANKITDVVRGLARVTQAISLFVYGGGRSGAVMPTASFDQFEKLSKPIMREGDEQAARDRWHRHSAGWDRFLDLVEDELVGRSSCAGSAEP